MAELPDWVKSVWWWARWWVRCFPGQSWHRLTACGREHRGPIYDGIEFCLHCGAPWFSSKTLVEITHGVKVRNIAARDVGRVDPHGCVIVGTPGRGDQRMSRGSLLDPSLPMRLRHRVHFWWNYSRFNRGEPDCFVSDCVCCCSYCEGLYRKRGCEAS